MKHFNLKRPIAVILASLLMFSSASFVATAQEDEPQVTPTFTYTLRGEKTQDGDYAVEVLANGGLINTGYIKLTYDADLYSDVVFELANNIGPADFFWSIPEEQTAGTIEVGFMSWDDSPSLFAEDIDNPSNNIAYIDASGENLVRIGTFTFTFEGENTYETAFTTTKAPDSKVTVEDAKVIPHDPDSFAIERLNAEIEETTMLVFSAEDFDVSGTTTNYNGEPQSPTVESDVAEFTLALGDDEAEEVTDAGTYAIKAVDVTGEGYYDAASIDLGTFTINRGAKEIAYPGNPESVPYDPEKIEVTFAENWEQADETVFNKAGLYEDVRIKYTAELDDNIDYTYEDGVVVEEDEIVAYVDVTITQAEASEDLIPVLGDKFTANYNPNAADQTIENYDFNLSTGWEFPEGDVEVSTTAKEVTVRYYPSEEDLKNYDFSEIEGYTKVEEEIYIERKVTVVLNKITGTAPVAPVVITDNKRLEEVGGKFAIADFVTAGDWKTTVTELGVGKAQVVTFIYTKDIDTDNYTYADGENGVTWDAENGYYTYTVTLTVDKPYIPMTGIYPPENPAAKPFVEGMNYTTADFALANGWEYAENEIAITTAGTIEDVKVIYPVPADYEVDPEAGFTTEEIEGALYIVSTVDITVNKKDIPEGAITFAQESVFTGETITLDKTNIVITGLTGVTVDNISLIPIGNKDVGTYEVYASVTPEANYNNTTAAIKIGTLTITPAEVTKDMLKLEYDSVIYNGEVKKPTVTSNKDGVIDPTTVQYLDGEGNEVEPKAVGTYKVKVSAAASGNYQNYEFTFEFKITQYTITINKPADPEPKDYVKDGFDPQTLTFTDWVVTDTDKLDVGTHTVNIKYNGTLDTANNTYVAGEGVTGNATEGFTATVTLVVKKIAGTVEAPVVPAQIEFNPNAANKNISSYVTLENDWAFAEDIELAYTDNTVTVQHVADTKNYTWDGYTIVGEESVTGTISKTFTVTFNKKVIETTVPPVLVDATPKTFDEAGYAYSDFAIATAGWVYKTPDARIDSVPAESVKATVLYAIGEDYTVAENSEWDITTNEGYITSTIELTVVRADVITSNITFADQNETYDGEAVEINKANLTVTGMTGVTVDNVTLSLEEDVVAKNYGEYTVYATVAETTNYNAVTTPFVVGKIVIAKATLTAENFAIDESANNFVFDNTAKMADVNEVDTVEGQIGDVTVIYKQEGVPVDAPKNAGTYDVFVTVTESTNYNALGEIKVGSYEIKKAELSDANFVIDAKDFTYIKDTAQRATVSTQNVVGDLKEYITVTYKQEGVPVDAPKNAGTYDVFVTVTVSENYKALGETYVDSYEIKKADGNDLIPALTKDYEATFTEGKGDFKVTTYVQLSEGWSLVETDAVLEYKADNKYTVETAADTDNYTYTVEGITPGTDKLTAEITVNFKKATLPPDAASTAGKNVVYDTTEQKVEVTVKGGYNGLGDMTVTYPQGNIKVGTYNVVAIFGEGDNYLAGQIVFEGVLVITKAAGTVVIPEIEDQLVDTTLSGAIGETGWSYKEAVTIVENDNNVTITTTIPADKAHNYDYSEDKVTQTYEIIEQPDGSLVIEKAIVVTGYYGEGTVNLTITTDSKQTGDTTADDVTITVAGRDNKILVYGEDFTENGNNIVISGLKLREGDYTITVKKTKYITHTITLTVVRGETVEKTEGIKLISGDIVGGPVGSETIGNDKVDMDDFVIAIRAFDNESSDAIKNASNIDEDESIGVLDLGFIKTNFGKTTDSDEAKTVIE